MKVVRIPKEKTVELTQTMTLVILALKRIELRTCILYIQSLFSLYDNQCKFLMGRVTEPYSGYYAYEVTETDMEITEAEFSLVRSLYNLEIPQKVSAVKFMRAQYAMSLKEAKDMCDIIGKNS